MRDFENAHDRHWHRHHPRFDEQGDPGSDPQGHRGRGGRGEHGGRGGGPCGGRLERGSMRFLILDSLRDGAKHGYEIMKGLRERTRGQYAPSPGRVYPILQLLSDLELVRSDSQDDRRVYYLTDEGRTELDANADKIAEFWANFEADAPSEPMRLESEFLQEELDSLAKTVWTGLNPSLSRGDREAVRRVRQLIERCRADVRDLLTEGVAKT